MSDANDPPREPETTDPEGSGLEAMLEEIETVVEPVTESVSMAPAVGIAVAGGPMITLPDDERATAATKGAAPAAVLQPEGPGLSDGHAPAASGTAPKHESVIAGLTQAGPVALAGMFVNGAAVLVVVVVARLVTPASYGAIAQLLGLFFILSMPGSAVLVGVVRRVTALQRAGHAGMVRQWAGRLHRIVLAAIVAEAVIVLALQGWIARQLSLPNSEGVALILVSGGIWILLSVDRGLLQAHRGYRALAGNLLVEGGFRTVFVIVFVGAHMGVAGYALGVFISETLATIHARWLATRVWSAEPEVLDPAVVDLAADSSLVRRRLVADVSAAFVGLALLGLLQNVDVILLGRLDHANVGPYAAISVASKALVFGALALGAYLLPEATIRWNEGGHAVRQLGVTLIFLAVPSARAARRLLAGAAMVPNPGVLGQAEFSSPRLRYPGGGHDVPFVLRSRDQLSLRDGLPLDRVPPSRWSVPRRRAGGHGGGRDHPDGQCGPHRPGRAGCGDGRGFRRHSPQTSGATLVFGLGADSAKHHLRIRANTCSLSRRRAAPVHSTLHRGTGRPKKLASEVSGDEACDRGA